MTTWPRMTAIFLCFSGLGLLIAFNATGVTCILFPDANATLACAGDRLQGYGDLIGGIFTFGAAVVAWSAVQDEVRLTREELKIAKNDAEARNAADRRERIARGLLIYTWAMDLFETGLHVRQIFHNNSNDKTLIETPWRPEPLLTMLKIEGPLSAAVMGADLTCSMWNRHARGQYVRMDKNVSEAISHLSGNDPLGKYLIGQVVYRSAKTIAALQALTTQPLRPEIQKELDDGARIYESSERMKEMVGLG